MPAGHDRDREVEADDRVHRDDQRRREAGEQQVRRLVAVPVLRRAAPAHREHAVDDAADARLRSIAQRRQVGNQPDEPEQQRHRRVGRHREHVPDQRAAELRPDAHRVRVREQPVDASHGRPVWRSGKMPAHATANSVIASANRLIEVRHVCLSSSRIAEISVPAWPMPIHQTKLMMANPQPTGMFTPQMPMPLTSRYVERHEQQRSSSRNATPKPSYQPSGVFRVEDDRADLVGDRPKVWPGAITGGRAGADRPRWFGSVDRLEALGHRLFTQLRVHVAHGGEIGRARPRVQLGRAARSCAPRPAASRRGSSGSFRSPKTIASAGHACWHAVLISPSRTRRSPFSASILRGVDPLHAVGALLHHAAAAHGDVGVAAELRGSACRSPDRAGS